MMLLEIVSAIPEAFLCDLCCFKPQILLLLEMSWHIKNEGVCVFFLMPPVFLIVELNIFSDLIR